MTQPTTNRGKAIIKSGFGYWAEFEGGRQFAWACAFRRAASDAEVTLDGKEHLGCKRITFPNGDIGWAPFVTAIEGSKGGER